MQTGKYLSELERSRFDVIADSTSIKEAANKLSISPQTLYNWTYQLKKKYNRRRGWVNAVLAQHRRSELLKRVLSEKRLIEGPDEDEGF